MLRNADPPIYWVSFISKMELLGFRQARFKYNIGQISNMIPEVTPESVKVCSTKHLGVRQKYQVLMDFKTADDLCASFCAMAM
jgi:hypothetical protein